MIPLVHHPRYNIVSVFPFRPPHRFVSDDVEQVALVAPSLTRHPDDVGTWVRTCRLP